MVELGMFLTNRSLGESELSAGIELYRSHSACRVDRELGGKWNEFTWEVR